MITQQTFDLVRRDHGSFASWAVWAPQGASPKSNIGDMTVLDPATNPALLSLLHTRFVLFGLNISRQTVSMPLANFHDPRPRATDFKIRAAFHGTACWGAYMSDVIKHFPEKCSGKMAAYLRKNQGFELEQIAFLHQELELIGATDATLVAFGRDAEGILRRHVGETYRIVGVPHYAAYMSGSAYRECVHGIFRVEGIELATASRGE